MAIKYSEEVKKSCKFRYEVEGWSMSKISKEYEVPTGTIKDWSSKENWTKGIKKNTTNQPKKKPTNQPNDEKMVEEKIIEISEVKTEEDLKETEDFFEEVQNKIGKKLTNKQLLFCIYYVKYHNATLAVKKAGYNSSYPDSLGSRILKIDYIKEAIKELKSNISEELFLTVKDIQIYLEKVLLNDMTEHKDGQLINEISTNSTGTRVKSYSKEKAVEQLLKILGVEEVQTAKGLAELLEERKKK